VLQCGHLIGPHHSTLLSKFMHELKCDLCSARLFSFSLWAVSVLLEEHMKERHPAYRAPKYGEALQLSKADEEFLTSMRIGW
jgi:hypothetical protein